MKKRDISLELIAIEQFSLNIFEYMIFDDKRRKVKKY